MMTFLNNPVLKRFAALASGSAAGQIIMIVALPIATQIYNPTDFGTLAAFSSLVLLVLPAVSLRFDLAIPIPEQDSEALSIAVLALVSATGICLIYSLILAISVGLWGGNIKHVVNTYDWLVVLALWCASIFSLLQYLAIRMEKFRALAFSHAMRGILGASTQLGLGVLGVGTIGLLLGQSIYMGLGAVLLASNVLHQNLASISKLTLVDVRLAARKHWRFPVFSTPEALLNSVSANLPILLIVSLVGVDAGGLLYVAQRLTSIPVGLISGNLGRVYLGEAPVRERRKQLYPFTRKLVLSLFFGGLPVAIAVFVYAQPIATRFLGGEWNDAARYIVWLVPAALLQFTVVPVATVLHLKSKHSTALLIQLSGLILQVGPIMMSHLFNVVDPILGFATGSALHYVIYIFVTLSVARDR
jgi:O-antigen/teichoic acid export membrane protein